MRFFSYIILVLLALFTVGISPSYSDPPLDLSGDDALAQKTTSDGKKLVDQTYKNVSVLNDYKFESVLYMYKPKPKESGAGTLFFKRPKLVKLEIKSLGMKDGTVVVRQPDGRVRVIGGPKLRFLKMNLDEDSRMLQTPNGFNVVKSDFASLFATVNAALANGSKAKASAVPLPVSRLSKNVTILELVKNNNGEDQLTDRIFIDPQTSTPVEWDIFKNGDRYSVTLFQNFSPNIGLQDDQFKL